MSMKSPVVAALLGLCMGASSAAPPDRFAWVKDYRSVNEAWRDPRFVTLIAATVPRYAIAKDPQFTGPPRLSTHFEYSLAGPPDDTVVRDGRYASLSACWPHNCGEKALLWVDTAKGRTVGALLTVHFGSPASDAPSPATAAVFSKSFRCEDLPAAFWTAFDEWSRSVRADVRTRGFIGADGRRQDGCLGGR